MLYYYLCAAFTLISASVSLGFSVEACLRSKPQRGAASINAKYAASRSLSLLIAALGTLIFVHGPYLIGISAVMIAVQMFDGIIGVRVSRFKTVGPILTAAANAVLLMLFLCQYVN
jgi:hypothetical protein